MAESNVNDFTQEIDERLSRFSLAPPRSRAPSPEDRSGRRHRKKENSKHVSFDPLSRPSARKTDDKPARPTPHPKSSAPERPSSPSSWLGSVARKTRELVDGISKLRGFSPPPADSGLIPTEPNTPTLYTSALTPPSYGAPAWESSTTHRARPQDAELEDGEILEDERRPLRPPTPAPPKSLLFSTPDSDLCDDLESYEAVSEPSPARAPQSESDAPQLATVSLPSIPLQPEYDPALEPYTMSDYIDLDRDTTELLWREYFVKPEELEHAEPNRGGGEVPTEPNTPTQASHPQALPEEEHDGDDEGEDDESADECEVVQHNGVPTEPNSPVLSQQARGDPVDSQALDKEAIELIQEVLRHVNTQLSHQPEPKPEISMPTPRHAAPPPSIVLPTLVQEAPAEDAVDALDIPSLTITSPSPPPNPQPATPQAVDKSALAPTPVLTRAQSKVSDLVSALPALRIAESTRYEGSEPEAYVSPPLRHKDTDQVDKRPTVPDSAPAPPLIVNAPKFSWATVTQDKHELVPLSSPCALPLPATTTSTTTTAVDATKMLASTLFYHIPAIPPPPPVVVYSIPIMDTEMSVADVDTMDTMDVDIPQSSFPRFNQLPRPFYHLPPRRPLVHPYSHRVVPAHRAGIERHLRALLRSLLSSPQKPVRTPPRRRHDAVSAVQGERGALVTRCRLKRRALSAQKRKKREAWSKAQAQAKSWSTPTPKPQQVKPGMAVVDEDEEMSDSSAEYSYDSDGDADMGGYVAPRAPPSKESPPAQPRSIYAIFGLEEWIPSTPVEGADATTTPAVASKDNALVVPLSDVDASMATSDASSSVATAAEAVKPQQIEVPAAAATPAVLPESSPVPIPATTVAPHLSAERPAPAAAPTSPINPTESSPLQEAPAELATPAAPIPPPVIAAAEVSVLDYGMAPEPVAKQARRVHWEDGGEDDEDDPSQWETVIPHPQASQTAAPPPPPVAEAKKPEPVFKVPAIPEKVAAAARVTQQTTPPSKTEQNVSNARVENLEALRRLALASRVSSGPQQSGMSPSQRRAAKLAQAAAAKKVIEDAIAATTNLRDAETSPRRAGSARRAEARASSPPHAAQSAEEQMEDEPQPLDKGKGRALNFYTATPPSQPTALPTADGDDAIEMIKAQLSPAELAANLDHAVFNSFKAEKAPEPRTRSTVADLSQPGCSRHKSASEWVDAPAKQVGTFVRSATIRSSRDKESHDSPSVDTSAGEDILVDVDPPAVLDEPSSQTEIAVEASPASPLDWDVEDLASSSPAADKWQSLQPSPVKDDDSPLSVPVIEITPPSPSLPPTPAPASPPPAPLSAAQVAPSEPEDPSVVDENDDDEDFPEPLWPRSPSTPSAAREARPARPLPKRIARQPAPKLVVSTWSSLSGALGDDAVLNSADSTRADMAVVQASPTESASEPVQKSETEPEDLPSPCISLYSEDEEPMCAGTAMTHASTVQSYLLAEQPVVDVLSPEQKLCQALDNLVEVAGIVLGDVTPTPLASPSTIDRREDETDAVSALLALSAGTPAPHEQPHVPAPVTPVDVPSFSVSERPRPVAMDVEERAVSDVVVDVDIGCVPAEVAALDDGMDSSADIKDVVPPPADRHQGFLPDNVGHFVTPAVSSDLDAMSSEEMADQISETLAQMAAVPTSFSDMSDALMAELEVLIGTELNTMDVQVEAPPIGGGDTLMGFAQALSPVMEELEGESIPESIAVDSASSLHLVSPPDVAQPCDEDQELDEASALDACSSSEDTLRYDFPSPASPSPTLEAPSMASSSGGVHAAGPAEEPADSSLRSPDSTDSLASPRAVPSPERASNVEEPLVLAASPPHEPCSSEDRAEEAEVEELLISSEIRPVSETPSHNARDDKPDASPEATEVLQASEEKETEGPATPSQLPTKLVSPPVAANERLAEDAKDERQVEGDRELVSGSGEVEAEVKHDGKAPVQESNSQSSPSQSSPSPRPASSPRRSRFRSLSPTAQEALRSYILGETPPTPLEQLTPYSKLSRPVRLCKTRDYRRKQLSSLGRPLPEAILLDAISNARSAEPSSSESDHSPVRDVPQRELPRVTPPRTEAPRFSAAEQPRPAPSQPEPAVPPRTPRQRPPQRSPPAESARPDAQPRQEQSGHPGARPLYRPPPTRPSYAPPPVPEPPREQRSEEKPKKKSAKDKGKKSHRPAEEKPEGCKGDKKSRSAKPKKARAARAEEAPRAQKEKPSYPPRTPGFARWAPRDRQFFNDGRWDDGRSHEGDWSTSPNQSSGRASGSPASFAGEGSPDLSSKKYSGGRSEDVPLPDFSFLLWFLGLYWCWGWISSTFWSAVS